MVDLYFHTFAAFETATKHSIARFVHHSVLVGGMFLTRCWLKWLKKQKEKKKRTSEKHQFVEGKHIPNRPTYHNVVFVLLVVPSSTKAGDISASGQCAGNKKQRKNEKKENTAQERGMRTK